MRFKDFCNRIYIVLLQLAMIIEIIQCCFAELKALSSEIVDKWMKKVREKSSSENTENGKI